MTTADQAAARRVTYQLETLWDYDYEPTHDELAILYETAKKNQWNGSTAIDWSRPVGRPAPERPARRDSRDQYLGAEAPGHADDRRRARHRRLQPDAQADRGSDPGGSPGLRPAGRGPPRELRLLRVAALDPDNGAVEARAARGLHLPGVRPDVRPGRADRIPVGEERL